MSKLQKLVSLLLCACMLLSAAALAEDAPTADTGAVAAITAAELASDTVLATVNGDPIIWGDLASAYNSLVGSYGSYYDLTLQENIELFRAVALENIITERLLMQKAKELGLDQLSEEEAAEQKALRLEYAAACRASLRASLENTYIVEADGTKRKVRRRDEAAGEGQKPVV